MMPYFKIFFLVLTIISTNLFAEEKEQFNCNEKAVESKEILKLFKMVKNSVLGTVPQFCREDKPEQLADKDDAGQADLTSFVKKLKNHDSNLADTLKLDKSIETKKDIVVFNTIRLVVLKKMWSSIGEEKQDAALVSAECGSYGLNRVAFNKKPNKVVVKDADKAYKTLLHACKTSTFSDLAPYLTKDVLAESLFSLKKIFPVSFPELVDQLCVSLSDTNELIFKDDPYLPFSNEKEDLEQKKDFSNWLLSLYLQINKKEEAQLQAQLKYAKEMEEAANKQEKLLAEMSADIPGTPKNLEKVFLNAQVEGTAEKNPPHPTYPNYVVAKAANGKYFLKMNDEQKLLKKENEKKELEKSKLAIEKSTEDKIKTLKTQLESFFKNGKVDENMKGVPYPQYDGYFIGQKEDGSHYIFVNEATKLKIKALKEQKEDKNEEYVDKYSQATYKKLYEKQEQFGDDYYDPKSYGSNYKIELKNGKYYVVKSDKEKILEKLRVESQDNVAAAFTNGDSEIPMPSGYAGYAQVMLKNESGNYVSKSLLHMKKDEVKPAKRAMHNILESSMKASYQERTSDPARFPALKGAELQAVKSYTSAGFIELNGCLRKESCSDVQKKQVEDLINALKNVRNKKQDKDEYITLYRGAKLPTPILNKLKTEPKNFILDKGFMSTSGDVQIAKNFGGIYEGASEEESGTLYILKTKSCVGISSISSVPYEDEFICPPSLKFNVKRQPGKKNIYIVEEVAGN